MCAVLCLSVQATSPQWSFAKPASSALTVPLTSLSSVPGAYFEILERETKDFGWTFQFTGERKRYLNLGSYNYLGYAENEGPCAEESIKATQDYGLSCCSPRSELGTTRLHEELEALVAEFVHKPAAITFGMGFATNATNMPLFVGKGCLIISDSFNHTSLVLGARLSGAKIRVFKHNGNACCV